MLVDQRKVVSAQFYIDQKWGNIPRPNKSIILLMGHRSGSTLLCNHLESINHGKPIEAFHHNSKRLSSDRGWHIDFNDPYAYMVQAIDSQTTDGIFATKMSYGQFQVFLDKASVLLQDCDVELNDAELVSTFFPNPYYLYLVRMDKVKQAVSFSRALQNGIWNLPKEHSDEYKKYLLPAAYDREHIEGCLELSLVNDVAWKDYLDQYQLTHLRLEFENLISDYQEQLSVLHEFLAVDKNIPIPEPQLKKISSSVSDEWVERFMAETDWIHDHYFVSAMLAGDLKAALDRRSYLFFSEKERTRWNTMPANRYKKARTVIFRVKRKLKEMASRS